MNGNAGRSNFSSATPFNPSKLAELIISKADRDHPADAVLRAELKRQTGLTRADSRAVSQAVFNYYRWFGWLDPAKSIAANLFSAEALAERFAREPHRFADDELAAKAIPAWAAEHVDVTAAWLRTLQKNPRLWLRAKHGQAERLAQTLGFSLVEKGTFLTDALEYRGTEDLFRSPEFHAGEFELQDISSQAVGVMCDPQPGETWWDACAGEGGKLLHFAELMKNKGLVWATDRAEWRLRRLKQRAARAKAFNYRAAVWSDPAKLPTKTKFDGVLVDAPCTGIGTWQRNPQARWTTTPQDVLELAEIQKNLLGRVADSIKPGGKLVYSVCTLARAETEEVARAFGGQRPDFAPFAMRNPFDPEEQNSKIWFWPQDHGGNGMFVAAWKRVA